MSETLIFTLAITWIVLGLVWVVGLDLHLRLKAEIKRLSTELERHYNQEEVI